MKALVLGGYGAVGAHIVSDLRAHGDTAYAAGRDPARADRVLDLDAGPDGGYRAALDGIDVVVNSAGAEDPRLVAAAAEHGCAFVDITATTSYVNEVEQLAPAAPVVLSVGLAPGLTTLLAKAVHSAAPGPVDIASTGPTSATSTPSPATSARPYAPTWDSTPWQPPPRSPCSRTSVAPPARPRGCTCRAATAGSSSRRAATGTPAGRRVVRSPAPRPR